MAVYIFTECIGDGQAIWPKTIVCYDGDIYVGLQL